MPSRSRIFIFSSLAVVAGALFVLSFQSQTPVPEATTGTASLIVDFGDAVEEWQGIPLVTGTTAFSILHDALLERNVPLVYDPSKGAGVFVRQIGTKNNGDKERYWQYWVNGKYAMVAADQKFLAANDVVLWKFTNDVPTDY